jgi:hypothetical protein
MLLSPGGSCNVRKSPGATGALNLVPSRFYCMG